MAKPRVMYWFRTDLRLHDSPALKAALDLDPACLYPVWTWDPHYVYQARVGPNRWQFLIESLNDLSASLTRANPRSQLFLVREGPLTVLPKLWKAWNISHVAFEEDTDTYAAGRDDRVREMAREAGVVVVSRAGRTLYDPVHVVRENRGRPTMSMAQLQAAIKKLGSVPRPTPAPKTIPSPGPTSIESIAHAPPSASTTTTPSSPPPSGTADLNAPHRTQGSDSSYAALAGPDGAFAPPTLAELGLDAAAATTPHHGGETRALARLAQLARDRRWIATFEKPNSSPAAWDPPATTLLSPYLHFGALGCREFYWRVVDVVEAWEAERKDGGKKADSMPPASGIPVNLVGQLLFRDMYFAAQHAIGPAFATARGNPHCRFIPWHLATRDSAANAAAADGRDYAVDSPAAELWLARWRDGTTGFPWIDALMRQLRREGWMHHLGRHSVACFLTRGGCYISWERGAAVFEELLLDHEPAANAGNWQWLACAAFFAQYHRCYSPVAFPKKWGAPARDFVRRYVPELAEFPDRFLFEPWLAPLDVQRRAGCLVKGDGSSSSSSSSSSSGADGDDDGDAPKKKTKKSGGEAEPAQSSPGKTTTYPVPMFDFAARREICLRRMKEAFAVGLHGNDKPVLKDSYRDLFPDHYETDDEDRLDDNGGGGSGSGGDGDGGGGSGGKRGLGGADGDSGGGGDEAQDHVEEDVDEYEEERHGSSDLDEPLGKGKARGKSKGSGSRSGKGKGKGKGKPPAATSPAASKRQASQSTLDGLVKRSKN